MHSVLSCTVRGCGLALERRERTWVCRRGHSYDVARHGYVSLLQPQDRRSLASGDSKETLDARTRLLANGVGQTIVHAFITEALTMPAAHDAAVLDLGCGGGEVLAEVAQRRPITGIGIDLSSAAADLAARRFPALTWVVANADRRLPVLDRSVDVILSFNGRRNPQECARVLSSGGTLVMAVPAPDDLIELREQVLGGRTLEDRAGALIEEHNEHFIVAARGSIRQQYQLTADQLRDLLRATYRGARSSTAARVAALGSLDVTFASEIVRFEAKPAARQSRR